VSSLQQSLKPVASRVRASHLRDGAGFLQQQKESKMKKVWKLSVPAAMFVVAASVGAMTTSGAHAGEYCRTDMTAHMRSCGFDTMEQCQAYASGMGGDCSRDPNLPANSASNANSANRNALAYQSRGARSVHHGRHGHTANPE
jgi:hypothetical protein